MSWLSHVTAARFWDCSNPSTAVVLSDAFQQRGNSLKACESVTLECKERRAFPSGVAIDSPASLIPAHTP